MYWAPLVQSPGSQFDVVFGLTVIVIRFISEKSDGIMRVHYYSMFKNSFSEWIDEHESEHVTPLAIPSNESTTFTFNYIWIRRIINSVTRFRQRHVMLKYRAFCVFIEEVEHEFRGVVAIFKYSTNMPPLQSKPTRFLPKRRSEEF